MPPSVAHNAGLSVVLPARRGEVLWHRWWRDVRSASEGECRDSSYDHPDDHPEDHEGTARWPMRRGTGDLLTDTLLAKQWHHLPEDEVAELLETDASDGLDTFAVERRGEHFGPNTLTVRRGPGALLRLLLQFHQPLIYILIAAGVI